MSICPLSQWKAEWPAATLYGCPGLKEKKPEQGYDEEVGDTAPASWLGEIECAHMKHEAVPIFNVPFFSEVCTCLRTDWREHGILVKTVALSAINGVLTGCLLP